MKIPALLVLLLTACAHVVIDTTNQCRQFQLSEQADPDAGAPASSGDAGIAVRKAAQSFDTSSTVVFSSTLSGADLKSASNVNVTLSSLVVAVENGDFGFADRIVLTIQGADPNALPEQVAADYTLSASDAHAPALTIPVVLTSPDLAAYVRGGSVTLKMLLTAHAAHPGAIDLSLCYSESASWDWNVVNGVH